MKIETYTLPAFWASALVNGDQSSLPYLEAEMVYRWLAAHPELGGCLSCTDDPSFRRNHDAPEVLACDCLDFSFPVI